MVIAPAQQDIRLNADTQHLLDAVLRGLGLEFARGRDEGHQGHMHEERILRAELQAHLANRFQERQGLDIPDRPANFHDHDVHAFGDFADAALDLVGDVRDDLHGFSQVIAAALPGENGFVDAPGGPVVVARQFNVGEALVVPEVEVRLRSVVRDENLPMLKGAHRSGIHVQVGIDFLDGDFEAATFEETTDGGCCYAFAK